MRAPADPRGERSWGAGAREYLGLGIQHILLGMDHLLFALAHSITLALAKLNCLSVPIPPLNAAIALSILSLGPQIMRSWHGNTGFTIRHPSVVAFLFDLLHGFGFASGLVELGLPRSEIPWALLVFNIGVELGQIAFIVLVLAVVRAIGVLEFRAPRPVALTPAYVVGASGAYWMIDRVLAMTSNFNGALT